MRVLIAGGGTAGHVNPGLAFAKYIKNKYDSCDIAFVGTEQGIESTLVPREGYELKLIRAKGFRRKLSFDTLKTIKSIFDGMCDASKILKEFRPDIVIGTGGYVCGPVLFVASRKKIPTIIHESNSLPGITNKILARFVDGIAISFKDSKKYFPTHKKICLTGNPIREEMFNVNKEEARKKCEISNENPTVLIFGGSRGAEKINKTVVKMIQNNYEDGEFNLIFATGHKHYDKIMEDLKDFRYSSLKVVPYIFDMANTMGAADLVVSRAGAVTISELAALGLPSILVPSPYVAENHQEYNARELEKCGASVVVLEKELSDEILYTQIKSLVFKPDKLIKMSSNAKKIAIVDATEKLHAMMEVILKEKCRV